MRSILVLLTAALLAACASPLTADRAHAPVAEPAVASDPVPDAEFPPRLESIHVPSGGVNINGVALVAGGAGPHPVFVLFHGLPGVEKNMDLAQAVRRAGWTVVTISYRGSWGSPGQFRFAQNLEDAAATLAYVRDPANAARLGIDPSRIVVAGHSMGGWVALETAAADSALLGVVTISAGDMGKLGALVPVAHDQIVSVMDDSRETLVDATGESMSAELAAKAQPWSFAVAAPKLKNTRLLVLYGNDFIKEHSESLIADVKAAGNTTLQSAYVETDHSWSGKRIELETRVIAWLQTLPVKGRN